MAAEPGAQFLYGENGFQVAGRMAEVATGRAWHDLFVERMAAPLGMIATDYAMRSTDAGIVRVSNPRLGSGLRTTARDLSRFVDLKVLRPETIALMFEDHTFGVPVGFSPNLFADKGYGLGVWRDEVDAQGRAILGQQPGRVWHDAVGGCGVGLGLCIRVSERLRPNGRACAGVAALVRLNAI